MIPLPKIPVNFEGTDAFLSKDHETGNSPLQKE
jgi:hypothetical protein